MKRNFKSFGKKIMLTLVAATILAVTAPTILSAQTSGTGLDGYTRVLWQGTDSSIAIWKLDGNLNVVYGVKAGPYPGWIPIGLTVGDDNYTRIMWRSTTGALAVWLIDPNLNYVSGYAYGPYLGWLPESTSVDARGYERVIWRHTLGYMSVWVLSPNQSQLLVGASYANSGYTPGQGYATTAGDSSTPQASIALGRAGQVANRLPDELTPHFQPLTRLPQASR